MADKIELGPLPNGWECKYDPRTRRNYFINYVNKTTTWDDPRVKTNSALQSYSDSTEFLPMQPQLHGTPDLRNVYPSHPAHHHPQPAFQMPNPYMQEVQRQDISNFRPSPLPGRAHTAPLMGSHAIGHHNNSRMQETSFSNAAATEMSVAKISAMFPTVSETHIRALLLKYHSREAVVISALQVEKNPITTPGPFSTPPLARHIIVPPPIPPPHYHSLSQRTPPLECRDYSSTPPPSLYSYGVCTGGGTLTGSPASSSYLGSPAFRHSPRPHSSPKMKLRYMKSMFPKADETIILDTLYNVDNNVQAATSELQAMGFDKRETPPPRGGTPVRKAEEEEKRKENELREKREVTPIAPPRMRSLEEKQQMCERLKKKHPDLGDHLITMALDSVDYDEDRAGHILDLVIEEENASKSSHTTSASSARQPLSKGEETEESSIGTKTTIEADIATQQTSSTIPSLSAQHPCTESGTAKGVSVNSVPVRSDRNNARKVKGKKDISKVSRGTSTTEDKEYRSPFRLTPRGPSSTLHQGPNDELLLEDYVSWTGPNMDLRAGHRTQARGPNKALLGTHGYVAKGSNSDLVKGPKQGLAKGSIYSHLTAAVTTAGESRGK